MFCRQCGNQMNDSDRFCPKCGFDNIPQQNSNSVPTQQVAPPTPATPPVQPVVPQTPQVAQPVQQFTPQAPQPTVPKKQKKKSKKPLIAITSLVLVVAIVVGVFFMLPKGTASKVPNSAVFKNQYGEYYLGTYNLENTGEFTSSTLTYDNEEEESNFGAINPYSTAYDGESFYGRIGDNATLFKTSFDSKSHANAEIWVSESNLSNMDLRAVCMYYFQADEDYIYFSYQPPLEYFISELEDTYKLGRISKDGKDIYLYDEVASSYAVKDGWIYYYDNGYVYDESQNRYGYNENNIGIYKMKVDGSNKQTLCDDFTEDDNEATDAIRCCDKLRIYGDNLYYLDYSVSGKSRVCRMDLDGNQLEYISENGAFNYAVDTENNFLYYSTGELGNAQTDKRTLYQVNLNNGEEESLMKLSYGNIDFSVYNNTLYFFDNNFAPGDTDNHKVSGMRYDIKNEKLQNLMGYYDIQDIKDGIFTERVTKGPYFYWEDAPIEN